jgi:hypothetical protein
VKAFVEGHALAPLTAAMPGAAGYGRKREQRRRPAAVPPPAGT